MYKIDNTLSDSGKIQNCEQISYINQNISYSSYLDITFIIIDHELNLQEDVQQAENY